MLMAITRAALCLPFLGATAASAGVTVITLDSGDNDRSGERVVATDEGVRPVVNLANVRAVLDEEHSQPGPDDLIDGWDIWYRKITHDAAVHLGFFATADLNANDQVMLFYYARHRTDRDPVTGHEVQKWGAGVQVAVKASSVDVSLGASLPVLAASAQLKIASVEARLSTFGVKGPAIDAAMPRPMAFADFNVQGYLELFESIERVRQAMQDDTTTITPRRLLIEVPEYDEQASIAAIARVYALLAIRDGLTLRDALQRNGTLEKHPNGKRVCTETYTELLGQSPVRKVPSEVQRAQAREALRTLGLENLRRAP